MGKLKSGIAGLEKLSLGISIVAAIIIGVGVGIGLRSLFGYEWLFWLGVFWGIAAAILNVYKAYKYLKKEMNELSEDPRYKNYIQQDKKDDEDND